MKLFRPLSRIISIIICAFVVFTFSITASADVDTALAALKDCVMRHVASEKTRQSPNVDRLLEKCKGEHNEVLSAAHPGLVDGLRELIEHDIQAELRRK